MFLDCKKQSEKIECGPVFLRFRVCERLRYECICVREGHWVADTLSVSGCEMSAPCVVDVWSDCSNTVVVFYFWLHWKEVGFPA